MSNIKRTLEEAIEIAKNYTTTTGLKADYPGIYSKLYKEGVLYDIIPRKYRNNIPVIEDEDEYDDTTYNFDRVYNQLVSFVKEENSTIEKVCSECGVRNKLRDIVISKYYRENHSVYCGKTLILSD